MQQQIDTNIVYSIDTNTRVRGVLQVCDIKHSLRGKSLMRLQTNCFA